MNNIMSNIKKLTAGVLAVGMLVAGIVVAPKQAEAAVANDVVVYEELDIATYWNDGKKAPVKEGYVFGGWFTDAPEETVDNEEILYLSTDTTQSKRCVPLTATQIDSDTDDDTLVDEGVTAYAKFVPAQVLSVKAQNGVGADGEKITSANDISTTNPMWLRVMTSLDSKNYDKIGFDIYLANRVRPKNSADGTYILETTKVYSQLYVGETLTDANAIFGGASEYVCVWKLDKIDTPSNADKIIYVRPYWHTMDGTKVLGLAKYVHIEDDYMNYISVPVNLLDGQNVAAGEVHMTYADTNAETASAWEVKEVEAGRVLPEMSAIVSEGTIKMVGNAVTVDTYSTDLAGERETIFANVRFKRVAEDATAETPTYIADTEDVTFTTVMKKFCDWTPEAVTISNIWDVKHDATETVSQ